MRATAGILGCWLLLVWCCPTNAALSTTAETSWPRTGRIDELLTSVIPALKLPRDYGVLYLAVSGKRQLDLRRLAGSVATLLVRPFRHTKPSL